MSARGELVPMTMGDGATIGVYQVQPTCARKGGLVLIQEIFGITQHIREQSDRFADEGYEVWAPAIFDREAPGMQLTHSAENVAIALKIAREQHPFATSVADTQVCIDALKARGKVFITGYCYGGSVTWAAACRLDGLAAASGYYGSMIASQAAETPRCPTILHFGRTDHSIPLESVDKIKAAHPEIPVYLYDAGHGFNTDSGANYEPESARLAMERTLALFDSASD